MKSKIIVLGYLHKWGVVSDFLQFGLIEDVHKIWRVPLMSKSLKSEKLNDGALTAACITGVKIKGVRHTSYYDLSN
tara:strand:- start:1100 stop:1327 length:228 start_codon:yes stop_codon:yes gene_type:complete